MNEYLSAYPEADKSTITKRSLVELYEDIIDREAIDSFEKAEAAGDVFFLPAAELEATHTTPANPKTPYS